jgi:hypothetical protein
MLRASASARSPSATARTRDAHAARRTPSATPSGTRSIGTRGLPVAAPDDALELEARATADRFATYHAPRSERTNVHPGVTVSDTPAQGQPLDPATRERCDRWFGFDFSQVRVHTDATAVAAAARLGARAYSVGNEIVFGRDEFSTAEPHGKWLLAHELAHVVQHSHGRGTGEVHRQPEAVPELDRKLKEALDGKDYQTAAEILNGFSLDDIHNHLGSGTSRAPIVLTRAQTAAVHQGALDNPRVGKDANVATLTRPAYLDLNFQNSIRKGDWSSAAEFLNAFNRKDMDIRLAKLSQGQLQSLELGAVTNPRVGPTSAIALAIGPARRAALARTVAKMQETGELRPPVSSAGAGRPGELTTLTVGGQSGRATGVTSANREPLSPATDWSKDPGYIDNNILRGSYNILTDLFEIEYVDHRFIHLDYGSLTGLVGSQGGSSGIGAGGLFFKNRGNGRIYPVTFSRATIPNIVAMTAEIAEKEPQARANTLNALISVAVAARGAAGSLVTVSKAVAGPPAPQPQKQAPAPPAAAPAPRPALRPIAGGRPGPVPLRPGPVAGRPVVASRPAAPAFAPAARAGAAGGSAATAPKLTPQPAAQPHLQAVPAPVPAPVPVTTPPIAVAPQFPGATASVVQALVPGATAATTTSPAPAPAADPLTDPKERRRRGRPTVLNLPPGKSGPGPLAAYQRRRPLLQHDPAYSRDRDAQAGWWDQGVRPGGSSLPGREEAGMNQRTYDRGVRLGLPEARIFRPDWTRLGNPRDHQVDHVVELQVQSPKDVNDWGDTFINYELLDQPTNGACGSQIKANIQAERNALTAFYGDTRWQTCVLRFDVVVPAPHATGFRWSKEAIMDGEHIAVWKKYRAG